MDDLERTINRLKKEDQILERYDIEDLTILKYHPLSIMPTEDLTPNVEWQAFVRGEKTGEIHRTLSGALLSAIAFQETGGTGAVMWIMKMLGLLN